jgi:hypothetical protein
MNIKAVEVYKSKAKIISDSTQCKQLYNIHTYIHCFFFPGERILKSMKQDLTLVFC